MRPRTPAYRLAILLCVLLAVCGCQKGKRSERVAIQGRVTVDGEPLLYGAVLFIPEGAGPKAAAIVRDGAYQIERSRGPLAGDMRVEIRAPKLEPGVALPDSAADLNYLMDSAPEALPARYNSKSELHVSVADSGPNQFEFELKSD